MDIDPDEIPDSYLCEVCSPRELIMTRAEAAELQRDKIDDKKKKQSRQRNRGRGRGGTARRGRPSTRGKANSESKGGQRYVLSIFID